MTGQGGGYVSAPPHLPFSRNFVRIHELHPQSEAGTLQLEPWVLALFTLRTNPCVVCHTYSPTFLLRHE